jgi:tRNA pseudouridine65 synthase
LVTSDLILHRVDDAVFVNKPSGQLVHNSAWAGPRERTLVDEVRDRLGPGLHPVHRLDRGASGVVLFSRDVARWQAALATGRKIYLALVRGHLMTAFDVDHPIRDEAGVAHSAHSRVTPLLRSTNERCSLVQVELLSGRHHQARRHLKHISHPIIGDATHGKGPLNREFSVRYGLTRLALHARLLDVDTACAVAPLPTDLSHPLLELFSAAEIDQALATLR